MSYSLNNEGIWFVFGYSPCLHVPDEVYKVFFKELEQVEIRPADGTVCPQKTNTIVWFLNAVWKKKKKTQGGVAIKGDSCTSIEKKHDSLGAFCISYRKTPAPLHQFCWQVL